MDDEIANFLAEEEAELNEDILCSFLDPEKENDSGEPNVSDSDRNQASWSRPIVSNPITGAQDLGVILTSVYSYVVSLLPVLSPDSAPLSSSQSNSLQGECNKRQLDHEPKL